VTARAAFVARRWRIVLVGASFLLVGALLGSAGAAKGGGGGGQRKDPACSVSPNPSPVGETHVVSVSGLPTDTAINLWVTDASGTVGRPLGSTPEGSFALEESSRFVGTTIYQFSGPERGNMKIYSTCFADAY
jgi:hypothetical protein